MIILFNHLVPFLELLKVLQDDTQIALQIFLLSTNSVMFLLLKY